MTTNPALALQTGLRTALLADSGLVTALGGEQVFDDVPRDAPFPYITVGDIDTATGAPRRRAAMSTP